MAPLVRKLKWRPKNGQGLKAASELDRCGEGKIMQEADVGIIGGGILGLATAYRLTQQSPARRVVILEKEDGLAQYQTGPFIFPILLG